jgi:hypothetical protein
VSSLYCAYSEASTKLKPASECKIWIALIVAAALFLLGTALVMSDPLFRAYIEKFQTLLAGLLAILAAGIAYCGAVTAARIQSKAVLDQAHAQAAPKQLVIKLGEISIVKISGMLCWRLHIIYEATSWPTEHLLPK